MTQNGPTAWRIRVYLLLALIVLPITPGLTNAQTTLDRRQPALMTSYKWASLTEHQRGIYIRSFLETVSFILYGHSQKDNERHAKIFSDWTLCAERQPISSWQTFDWDLKGDLEKTVAAQFYDYASIVCKDVAGTDDKKWRSVWLLKPEEWKSLSLHDRAIYLMAYVETVFAATRRAKDAANERKLNICIASAGIEGLLSSMEQTKIEWQYPLPWSASRALGTTCKGS
jgi:hypothetical protein